jgi:RNA polymerase sigma-70 factor (ECF subfamily)
MERSENRRLCQRFDFETLIQPHMQGLAALAWRLTGEPAQADDLVQETLLKAFRFFYRFEPGTNFSAWLVTMMRNLYCSHLRKRRREVLMDHLEHVESTGMHPGTAEPEVADMAELMAALPHMVSDDVYHALQALPENYRTVVLLTDILDYSYKEVARILGCPLGTVMSRLYRGRQQLQTRLQAYALSQGHIRTARAA